MVRGRLLEQKSADEAAIKKIETEVKTIVNEAAEFASHEPEPDPSELWTDITR